MATPVFGNCCEDDIFKSRSVDAHVSEHREAVVLKSSPFTVFGTLTRSSKLAGLAILKVDTLKDANKCKSTSRESNAIGSIASRESHEPPGADLLPIGHSPKSIVSDFVSLQPRDDYKEGRPHETRVPGDLVDPGHRGMDVACQGYQVDTDALLEPQCPAFDAVPINLLPSKKMFCLQASMELDQTSDNYRFNREKKAREFRPQTYEGYTDWDLQPYEARFNKKRNGLQQKNSQKYPSDLADSSQNKTSGARRTRKGNLIVKYQEQGNPKKYI